MEFKGKAFGGVQHESHDNDDSIVEVRDFTTPAGILMLESHSPLGHIPGVYAKRD